MTSQLPGYVLHYRVGVGAASEVWRAEAAGAPGRLLAVKRLTVAADRRTVADLRREGEVLARLSHPSILRAVDIVPDGDGVALVLPYAPGGSLADRLGAVDGGLPAIEVADVGARLAGALAAAHGAGLVHRDLKPANVLFDGEGQPLLADFGIAWLTGELAPLAGTAEYLDPAVVAGEAPDARSDVYGLAVTLYEALTGTPPYAGSTPRQTLAAADRGVHVPLGELVDVPDALAAAIERGFARDRDARFATAAEFGGRLDEARRLLEAGGAWPAGATGSSPAPGPPPVQGPGPTAAAGAAAGGAAGTAPPGSCDARTADSTSLPPGTERGTTRLFGPAPPRSTEPDDDRSRVDRRLLVTALVLVIVIPVAVVFWLNRSGDDELALPDGRDDAADGQPTGAPRGPDDGEVPAADPDEAATTADRDRTPRCDDVEPPEADTGVQTLAADVEGRGCTVTVTWDGHQLAVPTAEGAVVRYDLDADPDDVLLFGDWTCDGRDAPALYRPRTGQLFAFDDLTEDAIVQGEPTGVVDGDPQVVTDARGCDAVEVDAT